jgi:hypothetical protein
VKEKTNTAPILDTARLITPLVRHDDYLLNLPRFDMTTDPHDMRNQRNWAIRFGAGALHQEIADRTGEHSLDAHLYALIANIPSFYDGQRELDAYRQKYDHADYRTIPEEERQRFEEAKLDVGVFNDALKGVIEAGAHKFSFDELHAFITNVYGEMEGAHDMEYFNDIAREALVGMRSEVTFEEMMNILAIECQSSDALSDTRGKYDMQVKLPYGSRPLKVDVKSSEVAADKAFERAVNYRNDVIPIWPQVTEGDYKGKLSLPYDVLSKKAPDVLADLEKGANRLAA